MKPSNRVARIADLEVIGFAPNFTLHLLFDIEGVSGDFQGSYSLNEAARNPLVNVHGKPALPHDTDKWVQNDYYYRGLKDKLVPIKLSGYWHEGFWYWNVFLRRIDSHDASMPD